MEGETPRRGFRRPDIRQNDDVDSATEVDAGAEIDVRSGGEMRVETPAAGRKVGKMVAEIDAGSGVGRSQQGASMSTE